MDDDECGAVGGMIGRGNRSTRKDPAPVPFCPPQIPHDLTGAGTRATAVGRRLLTAWATARRAVLLQTLRAAQVNNTYCTFYRTWRFIPAFRRAPVINVSHINSIHTQLPISSGFTLILSSAVPELRWLVAGFPQRRSGFDHGSGHVTWDLWWTKWHWARFSPSTSVSLANHSTHPLLHTHHHPSS
jgi:hypothetical protein